MKPAQEETRAIERYGYLVCLVIFSSYLLVFFHRLSPSVLALDMQRSFGVGGALLGVLGSAYFYPYALMQLPAGLLADSWGARKTVAVFLLAAAAGSILMSASRGIAGAIAGRLLVGFGVSTVFVANFKLLSDWFTGRRMALLGGLFMAVGGLGAFAAGAPLAALSGRAGWRGTLAVVGGLSVVMAAAVWALVRNRPSELGWTDLRGEAEPGGTPAPRLGQGVRQVLGSGCFWPVAAWSGFNNGLAFAIGSMWGVPYLMHVYRLSGPEAGGYLSMFGLALIAGSPALAWLANLAGRKPVAVGSSALLAACLGLLGLFPGRIPAPALYPLFFCLFLSGSAIAPVIAVMARELFHPSIAGTSVGLVNCGGFFIAGVYQVLMGWMLDRAGRIGEAYTAAGYRAVFLLGLASALAALLASLFIRETLPPSERPAAARLRR